MVNLWRIDEQKTDDAREKVKKAEKFGPITAEERTHAGRLLKIMKKSKWSDSILMQDPRLMERIGMLIRIFVLLKTVAFYQQMRRQNYESCCCVIAIGHPHV